MQDVNQIRRQRIILDFLPFVYNIIILVQIFLPLNWVSNIINYLFGFGAFAMIELLIRSKDNNYCFWHRAPIYNCLFVIFVYVYNHFIPITTNEGYYALYSLFGFSISFFLLASIIYLKRRLKKDIDRCKKDPTSK